MRRLLFSLALLVPSLLAAADAVPETPRVLTFEVTTLSGEPVDMARYRGKVLLIANTASECGYTPQYADLQSLHAKHAAKGLAVLGFPCNQFGGQEPGTSADIGAFCTKNFGVTFDMFAKVDVKGPSQAPLFAWLTSPEASPADPGDVKWNFEKFLIGRDGRVIARYRSAVKPTDPAVLAAIEAALAEESPAASR